MTGVGGLSHPVAALSGASASAVPYNLRVAIGFGTMSGTMLLALLID